MVGSHVYLMAANTTGYGSAALSLLSPTSTGLSDSIGAYVLTAPDGSFSITGDYSCQANTQVYVLALGGNPGAGANSAAGFMQALGNCPTNGTFASTKPFIYLNEISTVASAYAMAGFAVDATHVSSSGSTLAQAGISNAFLTYNNLATPDTGVALTATPANNGIVPQKTINTIANILASCVNSTGPTSATCTTLFANAKSGSITPTETVTAAINIAHNPGANTAALCGLVTGQPAFAPSLTTCPNDFVVGITYGTVPGTTNSPSSGTYSIAFDSFGDAWVTNVNNNSVSKFASTGVPLSPSNGFSGGGFALPAGIAIDPSQNAWVVDTIANDIVKLSQSGSVLGTYTGGGLNVPGAISVDGQGSVFAVNISTGANSLTKFNNSGVPAFGSPFTGGGINSPTNLAVDQGGRVWITNQGPGTGSLSAFVNNGVPITTVVGYTGGGLNNPQAVAIDASNNIWVANYGNSSISKFTSSGAALTPSTGITGGGLNRPNYVAVDGGGNIWAANFSASTVTELNNTGAPVSGSTGYGPGLFNGPQSIAIDGSGNVWVANVNSNSANTAITELVGAGVPRVTPLSYAIQTGTLGTRP